MSRSLYARLHHRFGPPVDALSRRRMLAATLAAGAGLLLSGPGSVLRAQPAAGRKRVVVIGAGFAGLACAYELMAAGYDVTVVESRERVGGRVLSFADFVPGRNVEGGGELIGSNHPTWVAYAERFGLEFLDVTEEEDVLDPVVIGGKLLTDAEAEGVWEQMSEGLGRLNELAAPIDADAPWTSPEAATIDARAVQGWIDAMEFEPLAKAAVAIDLTANNGQHPSRQSMLGNLTAIKGGGLEKYWTDSEVYRCKGGNQTLAAKLAEAIGPDRLVTGLPVSRVTVRPAGAVVECRDGRRIECDDVVLTAPPSVWRRIEFAPSLPEGLAPQMGSNVKYLARLKDKFWRADKISQYALSDGPVQMTWDATDNQGDDGPACLVGFSGGPSAETCRGWSAETRDAEYAKALGGFYPAWAAKFEASRFMDWPGDAWAGASYSFPAPGQVTRQGPILARGLGRLHFAGEHTCYKFVGYMEGGLNSGVAVARRLATRDGVAK